MTFSTFSKFGVYQQLLGFLILLQFFVFIIKVSYGIANSTLLAWLPTLYLAMMLGNILILKLCSKGGFRVRMLDVLVISFFALDFIQIFNPYLGALEDQAFLMVGLKGFQHRSFFGMIYFIFRFLEIGQHRFNAIIRILSYTTAVGSLYAIAMQLFGFDWLESTYRAEQMANDPLVEGLYAARAIGLLGSPFAFGLVSAAGLVSSLYLLYVVCYSKVSNLFSIISVLANSMAIVLSGSRSTYLALIVVTFIMLTMRVRLITVVWRSRFGILAVLISLLMLFVVFPDSTPVQYSTERMQSINEIFELNDSLTDNNFRIRRELIEASIPMIVSNPFGYGSGIFNGGSNPDGVVTVSGYSTFMDNEYVSLALELGVLGVMLFLAIVVLALRRCYFALRSPTLGSEARVLAALVLICPVAGVGGQWLGEFPINMVFWIALGLISSLPLGTTNIQISRDEKTQCHYC